MKNSCEETKPKRKVLVYGDDISWGFSINKVKDKKYQWSNYLRKSLQKENVEVVENCLPGRTSSVFDEYAECLFFNRVKRDKDITDKNLLVSPCLFNGRKTFESLFLREKPDVLVLFVGINDLKKHNRKKTLKRMLLSKNNVSVVDFCMELVKNIFSIAKYGQNLHKKLGNDKALEVIVISPGRVFVDEQMKIYGFDKISEKISSILPILFEKLGKEYKIVHPQSISKENIFKPSKQVSKDISYLVLLEMQKIFKR
eukprot:snap_masked-scaffold_6-processed-gene-12.20-mRNA-1 protein AED:1.00 eAED:1.00 QI:0/-1/0/0/-1/1/1/0/255